MRKQREHCSRFIYIIHTIYSLRRMQMQDSIHDRIVEVAKFRRKEGCDYWETKDYLEPYYGHFAEFEEALAEAFKDCEVP